MILRLPVALALLIAAVCAPCLRAEPAGEAVLKTFIFPTRETDPSRCVISTRSLMQREIFRQAILIAAREGLGMATRDEAIGEPVSPAPGGSFDFELIGPDPSSLGGELSLVKNGQRKLIWKVSVPDDHTAITK